MSVRYSQLLVAIVLALLAVVLYRTVNAYLEDVAATELHARGVRIAERETQSSSQRVAEIETLAALTSVEGYNARGFADRARELMRKDAAIRGLEFFNAKGMPLARVDARGWLQFTARRSHRPHPSALVTSTIEEAVLDADLTRSVTLADVPAQAASASAPAQVASASKGPLPAQLFLAARVTRRSKSLGTIVAYLEPRRLMLNDLRIQLESEPFAVDDGRGHPLTAADPRGGAGGNGAQTFPIRFADRILQLTIPQLPSRYTANPSWFFIGWLALVVAICLPIEAVGKINRRVQTLNEELEGRVDERTRALQIALQESRRLATVVESVHEGVMWIDGNGNIVYVNDALCEELDGRAGNLLGRNFASVKALGMSLQQLDDVRKAVSESGFVYSEIERTRGDAKRYVAGVTFTRHSDGLGGAGGLIAVSRDITERRKLVDQLVAAKNQLEHEMRARADFIGTASHELRTPVTTLRTLAALLFEKLSSRYGLNANDVHLLDVLQHETSRLAHLVDDLLEIAKIDAPEKTLAHAVVDLRELVHGEMAVSRLLENESGAAIQVQAPDAATQIYGDRDALRSILNNLVDNARKFTPAHGHIAVVVTRNAERVKLSVSDDGAGIPQSDLPHIFERFYRARHTGDALGSGLGLAIVARLVELMHGTISVASEIGKGTTVSVEFACAAPVAGGSEAQQPARVG